MVGFADGIGSRVGESELSVKGDNVCAPSSPAGNGAGVGLVVSMTTFSMTDRGGICQD